MPERTVAVRARVCVRLRSPTFAGNAVRACIGPTDRSNGRVRVCTCCLRACVFSVSNAVSSSLRRRRGDGRPCWYVPRSSSSSGERNVRTKSYTNESERANATFAGGGVRASSRARAYRSRIGPYRRHCARTSSTVEPARGNSVLALVGTAGDARRRVTRRFPG